MTRLLVSASFFIFIASALPVQAGTASALTITRADMGAWASPNLLLILNQDQFAGHWKQFKGDLKQRWGNFTDDDLLYIEGSYEKYEGKVQERYGDRKEEIKQWMDEWFKEHDFDKEKQRSQAH
ncbi:MAG TPA: CsbD family protein [Nitrospiraceae bacterium]|nr:CsbD family protein [Nitrospiraceae bacterium]